MRNRFTFLEVRAKAPERICEAVRAGLNSPQRYLPTRFLYDRVGSELFEKITELPEYYLTRTEQAILNLNVRDILNATGENVMLVEFGSGSSAKTRCIIRALLERQSSLRYVPIDISHDFLCHSSTELLREFPGMCIEALGAEYFEAIGSLPVHDGPRMILFLGSNIGNLTHDEATDFLSRLRKQMTGQDRLLLGIDLAKPREIVEPAYNDAQGVTAAFNLNLLARLNRELDADFELGAFSHAAPYDEDLTRIEMQLISRCDQWVSVDGIGQRVRFSEGEVIHTEWSHKYSIEAFADLAGHAGLQIDRHWTDARNWFGTLLMRTA